MTVALRSPNDLGALIPVDNAPVDANLKSNFHQYVRGLGEIEEAAITKQAEADGILRKYEEVSKCATMEYRFVESQTYLLLGASHQTISSHEPHPLARHEDFQAPNTCQNTGC